MSDLSENIKKLEAALEAGKTDATASDLVRAASIQVQPIDPSLTGLGEATLKRLMGTKQLSLISHEHRIVFFSKSFTTTKPPNEVAALAFKKFVAPDVQKLDAEFEINGHLAQPSYIRLVDTDGLTTVAVFTFVSVAHQVGLYDAPMDERQFMKLLESKGISSDPSGIIASPVHFDG